jgi:hypothetical protein
VKKQSTVNFVSVDGFPIHLVTWVHLVNTGFVEKIIERVTRQQEGCWHFIQDCKSVIRKVRIANPHQQNAFSTETNNLCFCKVSHSSQALASMAVYWCFNPGLDRC